MCYIWKNPTHPNFEIDMATLEKLPSNFDYLNITGGEPTLRQDLMQICDLLNPKTKTLEISTNGLHPEKLVPIIKKYPNIKVRISVEGFEATNDTIRGEKNGFKKKLETMQLLIEAGGTDLGFATTFQDENIHEVVGMFHMAKKMNVELATSALHNAFQFHKNDNHIYERRTVAKKIEELIVEMLRTWSIKNWFRGYLNLGLIEKVLGHDRLHACTQGTDNVFLDPWGDVYACNVRNDLWMGNLRKQTWDEIYQGPLAKEIRAKVAGCTQNCWMVSSAKTAMRSKYHTRLPRTSVLRWVVVNKLRVMFGMAVPFEQYVDYNKVTKDAAVVKRTSYLNVTEKKVIQPEVSGRYSHLDSYINR